MTKSNADIIREVLKRADSKYLHVDQIAHDAIAMKLAHGEPEALSLKFGNFLSQHCIKHKGQKAVFARVPGKKKGSYKRGCYALKKNPIIRPDVDVRQDEIAKNFKGRAGEYGVISELMFRGYDATILPVDNGIDVIAKKDGKYFHIQVKTARESSNVYGYSINKNTFEANASVNTFYIFCLRRSKREQGVELHYSEYFIFHNIDIQRFIDTGLINAASSYGLRISLQGSDYFMNGKANINLHKNNFRQIA